MKIQSDEIPQADNLDDVIKTVACVAKGGETYQDIAKAIDKVDRQGRYYRKAAEILGFIESAGTNHSVITNLGKEFVNSDQNTQSSILINAVFNARLFQRLIPYFELNEEKGVTRDEIIKFILQVSEITADSMAPRRLSSVVAWLEKLEIISKSDNKYFLSAKKVNQEVKILEFTDIREPILPRSNDLSEYEIVHSRVNKALDDIIIYKNLATLERANNAHKKLTNLVAERVKKAGAIPKKNIFIDLAANHKNVDYIFEMKSTTDSNCRSQLRSGLSQLYEYRYLQNLPNARLVLVLEKSIPKNIDWMVEYLEKDRDVFLLWDGNNNLFGTKYAKENLYFLNIA